MKLVHPYYIDLLEIKEDSPETLVIERPEYFRKVINELVIQCNTGYGDFVLSEGTQTLQLNKECMLISDIFNLGFDNRSLKTKLQQILVEECQENMLEPIISEINQLGAELCSTSRYPITFNMNLTITDLVKMLDFSVDSEPMDELERLLEYISMNCELLGKNLVIVLGIKDLMSRDEYTEFIKMMQYRKIKLLMIEHQQHDYDDLRHLRIIDNDLCVI